MGVSTGNEAGVGDPWDDSSAREDRHTMKPLYKTTVVIWSEFDPSELSLRDLVWEATSAIGEAYWSKYHGELVNDPAEDPDWDGTDFFATRGEGDL